MMSVILICLISLIGTISGATGPVAVTLESLCNSTDPSQPNAYLFESLNADSSIEVTNEGNITCIPAVKVPIATADNYEVTIYFDTFTYDCGQLEDLSAQIVCKAISTSDHQYKSELFVRGSEFHFFGFPLPWIVDVNRSGKGKLKAYVTLVSKQDKDGKCLDGASEDTVFKCADNTCIYGDYKCNGVYNCNDRSDETDALCKPKAGLGWFSWLLIVVAVAVVLGGGAYVAYVKFLN
ncbi:hypothetical protein HDE_08847 [Halotydeus destructor]|nr:hypothetical protein HDE_08847 [Halotydeus destructor]